MNKKWVLSPVSFFERKEVCPCQAQAMESPWSALWAFWSWHRVRSFWKCPEDTVIASTDLFFSVHCEGALVHERKSWSGLCFGDWKPFQEHGLLWSQPRNEFLTVYNINSIIVCFWRLVIKTACFCCFKVIFVRIVYPLTTTKTKYNSDELLCLLWHCFKLNCSKVRKFNYISTNSTKY